jgi:hypothetical protein
VDADPDLVHRAGVLQPGASIVPSSHPSAHPARRRLAVLALAGLALLSVAPTASANDTRSFVADDGTTVTISATATPAAYYLQLLNCSRTGGYVQASGSCTGYGSGDFSAYVAPIKFSSGISANVSQPYAGQLAIHSRCQHDFGGGSPGDRLVRAGYHWSTWGENIGCRDGSTNVYAAILASHRAFQAEKATNGGHWKNLKNSRFTYVGIGTWLYSRRVRLVVDFYRPA